MVKQILQSSTAEERIRQLSDSADAVEMFTYSRELSMGEIQELQSGLAQDMISIDREDCKLKEAKEVYKSVTKPLKLEMREKLQMVRSQVQEVKEKVYLLKDLEEKKMGYYSKDGNLVFERALKPDEQQYSINEHLRKAE